MSTTERFVVMDIDGGSEIWEATDAAAALLRAIADATWDEIHEGRTITFAAYEETDDYLDHVVAWAEATVRGGRAVEVSVETQ